MHLVKPTGNAYNVATTIKRSDARNTPSRTLKTDSPPETAKAKTETTKAAINNSSVVLATGPGNLPEVRVWT